MRQLPIKSFVLLLTSFITAIPVIHAKPIRIFGTDLMAGWYPVEFEKLYTNPDYPVQFSLTGSYGGLIALKNGYADGCLYLQSDKQGPDLPEGYVSRVIGYYLLYCHVPSNFPETAISKKTLAAIAAKSAESSTTTWAKVLENPDSWENQSPSILLEKGIQSIAESIFRFDILQSEPSGKRLICVENGSDVTEAIAENNYFILVTDRPVPPEPTLKSIALVDFGENVGFPATHENIEYGDYSWSFPVLMIYPKNAKWIDAYMQINHRSEMSQTLSDHDLVPAQN